jgi:hypothetical protein
MRPYEICVIYLFLQIGVQFWKNTLTHPSLRPEYRSSIILWNILCNIHGILIHHHRRLQYYTTWNLCSSGILLSVDLYSVFGKSLCTYKMCSSIERNIMSKNWIKQLNTLPVLHFNRCLTTEYSETTAHFNGNSDRHWQPHLRTVADGHSDCPNALYTEHLR